MDVPMDNKENLQFGATTPQDSRVEINPQVVQLGPEILRRILDKYLETQPGLLEDMRRDNRGRIVGIGLRRITPINHPLPDGIGTGRCAEIGGGQTEDVGATLRGPDAGWRIDDDRGRCVAGIEGGGERIPPISWVLDFPS